MRVSRKMLETQVSNIREYTEHDVKMFMAGVGCGIYLTVDGIEYKVKVKGEENTYHGITNKKAYEILCSFDKEIWEEYYRRRETGEYQK